MSLTEADIKARERSRFRAMARARESRYEVGAPPPPRVMQPVAPTLVDPDPISWIETHFHIPETKDTLRFGDYQAKALRRALFQPRPGEFNYSTIVWSDIKKSIKSTIAAAVLLWRAFQIDADEGWGSFYIIANDLKQADSRVAYYVRRAIMLNKTLSEQCKVRAGSYKITLPNQTFIEAIPIDPSGEAGSNADMIIFSELWGAHSKAAEQMWTEMTLSPTKHRRSFRWVETYAGFIGKSPTLERLYEQGVKHGVRLDPDIEMFENRNGRLFELWNTRPRLPWQTEDYYAAEKGTLSESEFLRVHRNTWSSGGAERFMPAMASWDTCEEKPLPEAKTPLILGVDAGISRDSFGIVGVTAHPTRARAFGVYYSRKWTPKPNQPLDFDEIEDEIKKFCMSHKVMLIAYDPYQLHQMMTGLKKKTKLLDGETLFKGVMTIPFPQGKDRAIADKALQDAIYAQRVIHDGNSDLWAHIDNADQVVAQERKIRIVKRTDHLKVDLAVALSMAVYKAEEIWGGRTVYA